MLSLSLPVWFRGGLPGSDDANGRLPVSAALLASNRVSSEIRLRRGRRMLCLAVRLTKAPKRLRTRRVALSTASSTFCPSKNHSVCRNDPLRGLGVVPLRLFITPMFLPLPSSLWDHRLQRADVVACDPDAIILLPQWIECGRLLLHLAFATIHVPNHCQQAACAIPVCHQPCTFHRNQLGQGKRVRVYSEDPGAPPNIVPDTPPIADSIAASIFLSSSGSFSLTSASLAIFSCA